MPTEGQRHLETRLHHQEICSQINSTDPKLSLGTNEAAVVGGEDARRN